LQWLEELAHCSPSSLAPRLARFGLRRLDLAHPPGTNRRPAPPVPRTPGRSDIKKYAYLTAPVRAGIGLAPERARCVRDFGPICTFTRARPSPRLPTAPAT